jgi:hypothetical protein
MRRQSKHAAALSTAAAISLAGLFAAQPLCADVFVLNNDGRVEGTLLNPDESPRKNYIVKTGTGQITIDKSQVKDVIIQSPDELEYAKIRFTFADTVDEQWKLAEWCRERGLSRERNVHLERVVELDPNHKQARAALGYGQINGRWLRREDAMKERGYVWHRGRWMLPQDVEIQEQKLKTEKAEKEWFVQLRRARAQLDDRGPRAKAALHEFELLADPNAVPAIVELFKDERSETVQILLVAALARIKTPNALRVLADVALKSSNEEVRLAAIDHLKKIGSPASITHFVQALKNKDNLAVNRAGMALGELGDKSAIGPMIDVLVTEHKTRIQQGGPNTFSPSFDSNGGIGLGMGAKSVVLQQKRANRGVYEGLVALADGNDFGYDQQAWRHWLAQQKKPAAAPGRRD